MVLIVAAAIFQAIQGLLVLRIEGRVSATLIPAFWDRLLRLPSRFFARFSSGDLALRAMEFSEVFKKVSGAAVATVVTGFFSFFNLALLFLLQLEDGPVHDVSCWPSCWLVTVLLLAGLLALRELDPRDRRVDLRLAPGALGRDQHASNRRGRGPRLLALGTAATPSGSRWRSVPGDSRAAFINGWPFIRF